MHTVHRLILSSWSRFRHLGTPPPFHLSHQAPHITPPQDQSILKGAHYIMSAQGGGKQGASVPQGVVGTNPLSVQEDESEYSSTVESFSIHLVLVLDLPSPAE